eukprot:gene43234-53668_t
MKRTRLPCSATGLTIRSSSISHPLFFHLETHMAHAAFQWDDPFLLSQQLTDDERAIQAAAAAYCQDKLAPRVLDAFRHEKMDVSIFREMGEVGLLGPTIPEQYGLSARGLAIDTVGGQGEEFPRFTEFWLVRPQPGDTQATVYALLDSPRTTGAYRFDIRPGAQTTTTVTARIFVRGGAGPIKTLGIAPLTSMFLFGENQPRKDDFRPEVHDSDGLMVATGEGEWLWRPLQNPKQTLVTSFATKNPKGFGLMQRDRQWSSYEDVEARYERRPSAWVRPLHNWGPDRHVDVAGVIHIGVAIAVQ